MPGSETRIIKKRTSIRARTDTYGRHGWADQDTNTRTGLTFRCTCKPGSSAFISLSVSITSFFSFSSYSVRFGEGVMMGVQGREHTHTSGGIALSRPLERTHTSGGSRLRSLGDGELAGRGGGHKFVSGDRGEKECSNLGML